LLGLYRPSPSVDGEPFELSQVGFADRGKGNYGCPQLASRRRGVDVGIFAQFLPRIV
jgi:hypothetical protein